MPRRMPVPRIEALKLKDPREFRYIGKGKIGIVDLHDITTGKAHVRHRHAAAGHEVRRRRAAAGGRRQGGVVRRRRRR